MSHSRVVSVFANGYGRLYAATDDGAVYCALEDRVPGRIEWKRIASVPRTERATSGAYKGAGWWGEHEELNIERW